MTFLHIPCTRLSHDSLESSPQRVPERRVLYPLYAVAAKAALKPAQIESGQRTYKSQNKQNTNEKSVQRKQKKLFKS